MGIDQKYPYHSSSIEEAFQKLATGEDGLTSEEVEKRREEFGKNVLPDKGRSSPIWLFFKQFKDFLILILLVAAVIAFWAGKTTDMYIILFVVFFNAIMGFVQEFKAEKAIQAIKNLEVKNAIVRRNGEETEIPAEEVVPGDIIVLREGNTIPADARILEAKELRTSEASLTGESMPMEKNTEPVEENSPLGDRPNMAWKSTNVVNGAGLAVVTAIGNNTEIGKIAKSMGEMEMQDSNFRKKTGLLGKQMAGIAIGTSLVVFALGYWLREFGFEEILLVTIAVLVSTIPEGLPAVISIVLAIGAKRMAKQHVIIREFSAIEMMGSVAVILSDKTGTITQNILVVKKIFSGSGKEVEVTGEGYQLEGQFRENGEELEWKENPVERKLMTIAAFCNSAGIKEGKGEDNGNEEEEPQIMGDPTEVAMFVIGQKSKIIEQEPASAFEVLDEVPFKSEQKFRASLVQTDTGMEIFAIGAPERILELSSSYLTPDGPQELQADKKEEIEAKMDELAGQAMRVLALGYRKAEDGKEVSSEDVKELTWVGITGIIDPPREGVRESVEECKQAGIRVIMVTGDHKKTASAIAEKVGILEESHQAEKGNHPIALTTQELDISDEEFDEHLRHVNVFARMNPDVKLRIAERFQAKDTLIAMTGDGVNDAPALKRADVGISMGLRGNDVAKDASEIILQDDNFSSIVNAIREGRIVFNNVRITSYYLLTTNFAFAVAFILSMSLGFPLLLTAVQILYVNLVTSGIIGIALATEPGHGEIMQQPPLRKNEKILKWNVVPYIMLVSAIIVTLGLLTFQFYLPEGETMARTGTFVMVSMTQIFNIFNMRSLRQSIFEIGFFTNFWINIAFVAAIVLQFAVVKISFLRELMEFEDFPTLDFLVIMAISTVIVWAGEIYKYLKYKNRGK